MTDTDDVVLFELWHRAGRGHRWKKVGTAGTRAEALDQVRGRGDFHIREVRPGRRPDEEVKEKENGHEGRREG